MITFVLVNARVIDVFFSAFISAVYEYAYVISQLRLVFIAMTEITLHEY